MHYPRRHDAHHACDRYRDEHAEEAGDLCADQKRDEDDEGAQLHLPSDDVRRDKVPLGFVDEHERERNEQAV